MNKKVWITLLVLLIAALVAYNIVALFFPEEFIMCLTDTAILKFGKFIESRPALYWIVSILMTGTTYYLWSVIANRTFKIGIIQILTIPVLVALTYGLGHLVPQMAVANNIVMMLVIFIVSKEKYANYLPFYILHIYSQYMILFVRGYNEALPLMNIGSNICMYMESLTMAIVFCILAVCFKRREKNEFSKSTNH